jgi:two-component system KDP operon response regulator KdpE
MDATTASSGPNNTGGGDGGAKTRVLVVDDDADSVRFMAVLLRAAGFDVATATSYATALQAAAGGEPPHVLITDIGLPDASGIELLRELRRLYSVSGIALSGHPAEEIGDAGRTFDAYFQKPVDCDRVKREILRLTRPPT